MRRRTALRLAAGYALALGVLAVVLWQLGDDPGDAGAHGTPERTAPPVTERPDPTSTAAPESSSPEASTVPPPPTPTQAAPSVTPSPTKRGTPSPKPSRPTVTASPDRPGTSSPEDPDETSQRPDPSVEESADAPSPRPALPDPISFDSVSLDDVCNRNNEFTISWTASANAEGYDVSVYGASISRSYRGPGTSMTVSCPRMAGSVQVQGHAYNGMAQSDWSYLTLEYSPPMDEQPPAAPSPVSPEPATQSPRTPTS